MELSKIKRDVSSQAVSWFGSRTFLDLKPFSVEKSLVGYYQEVEYTVNGI